MISPADIRKKALRLWEASRVLRAELDRESLFPWQIPFAKPSSDDRLREFQDLRVALAQLREGAKSTRGYGYSVEWRTVNTRALGTQDLPETIRFDTAEDLCRFIGKAADLAAWRKWSARLLDEHPGLAAWLRRRPLKVIEEDGQWPAILAVLAYFLANPRPGLYLRELDIPGVDTKFIERNLPLLRELLDQLIPSGEQECDLEPGSPLSRFERRFGLKWDEPLIRYRDLDPESRAKTGFTDVSVPLPDFIRAEIECDHVFITENKVNGLSFPQCSRSLVIFGLGYGLVSLRDVKWLQKKNIWYWGDIDTHGFAMLDQVRRFLPHARSFLMDRETVAVARSHWGHEPRESRFSGVLENLTAEERSLFEDLKEDRVAPRLRLEQERIPFAWVEKRAKGLAL